MYQLNGPQPWGNVIIEALNILKRRGININEIALFSTPVRGDYVIPAGSVSKVYNFYGEHNVDWNRPKISVTLPNIKIETKLHIDLKPGSIKLRMPSLSNLNPIIYNKPRIEVRASITAKYQAPKFQFTKPKLNMTGDFVPYGACTDFFPIPSGVAITSCGIAGQTRNDAGVNVSNVSVPNIPFTGINVFDAHGAPRTEEYLSQPEVCAKIPRYCQ